LHQKDVPRDDAFVLLWDTAWNKHKLDTRGRDDPDNAVWRMIDKIWTSDDE
jgi:hypothetical protein